MTPVRKPSRLIAYQLASSGPSWSTLAWERVLPADPIRVSQRHVQVKRSQSPSSMTVSWIPGRPLPMMQVPTLPSFEAEMWLSPDRIQPGP